MSKQPMKMIDGMAVPLSADELAKRETSKAKPKPEGETPRERMLRRREENKPVTRAEFEELKAHVESLTKKR